MGKYAANSKIFSSFAILERMMGDGKDRKGARVRSAATVAAVRFSAPDTLAISEGLCRDGGD